MLWAVPTVSPLPQGGVGWVLLTLGLRLHVLGVQEREGNGAPPREPGPGGRERPGRQRNLLLLPKVTTCLSRPHVTGCQGAGPSWSGSHGLLTPVVLGL